MMNVKVRLYNTCKYDDSCGMYLDIDYNNIKGYEVKVIEMEDMFKMGYGEIDIYDEYLVITLENGQKATFRNSYCDLFIIH